MGTAWCGTADRDGVDAGAFRGRAPISPEVVQLALAGKKIEAIKVLREQTGLGLKESKDIVDTLAP